eukprot:886566-Prorocentrum_minimum.AAC.1
MDPTAVGRWSRRRLVDGSDERNGHGTGQALPRTSPVCDRRPRGTLPARAVSSALGSLSARPLAVDVSARGGGGDGGAADGGSRRPHRVPPGRARHGHAVSAQKWVVSAQVSATRRRNQESKQVRVEPHRRVALPRGRGPPRGGPRRRLPRRNESLRGGAAGRAGKTVTSVAPFVAVNITTACAGGVCFLRQLGLSLKRGQFYAAVVRAVNLANSTREVQSTQ